MDPVRARNLLAPQTLPGPPGLPPPELWTQRSVGCRSHSGPVSPPPCASRSRLAPWGNAALSSPPPAAAAAEPRHGPARRRPSARVPLSLDWACWHTRVQPVLHECSRQPRRARSIPPRWPASAPGGHPSSPAARPVASAPPGAAGTPARTCILHLGAPMSNPRTFRSPRLPHPQGGHRCSVRHPPSFRTLTDLPSGHT